MEFNARQAKLIREEFQKILSEKDVSILEVEKKMGLPGYSLRNFLGGRVNKPKPTIVNAFCKYFSLNIDDILRNKDDVSHIDLGTMTDIVKKIKEICQEKSIQLTYQDFTKCIENIYKYYNKYGKERRIESSFVEWMIDITLNKALQTPL